MPLSASRRETSRTHHWHDQLTHPATRTERAVRSPGAGVPARKPAAEGAKPEGGEAGAEKAPVKRVRKSPAPAATEGNKE